MTFVTVVSSPKGEEITLVTTVVTVVLSVRFLSKTCCWSVATLFDSGITTASFFICSFSPVASEILFAEANNDSISGGDKVVIIGISSMKGATDSTVVVSGCCYTSDDSLVC